MKHIHLLNRSCIGLLVATSASLPLTSLGNDLFGNGIVEIQAQRQQWLNAERGAQGPIRTDTMATPDMSRGEGTLYDDLNRIQSRSVQPQATEAGAQGPIRTDTMEPTMSYGEGALYDNLRRIQSGQ